MIEAAQTRLPAHQVRLVGICASKVLDERSRPDRRHELERWLQRRGSRRQQLEQAWRADDRAEMRDARIGPPERPHRVSTEADAERSPADDLVLVVRKQQRRQEVDEVTDVRCGAGCWISAAADVTS